MLFSAIPGHQELKSSLITAYNQNHIAHAQLFNSMEGGAALPMALAFATYLLCENKQKNDACGTCANCHKMQRLVHPDVHFFYPKSSNKSDYEKSLAEIQKSWRTFLEKAPYGNLSDWTLHAGIENKNVLISKEDSRHLIKTVSMKSFEGSFKILLIWYPEMMHMSAANAILKVLEEPPTQTLYLLVSHSYENLLATITSRTQLVVIPPFKESEIKEYLMNSEVSEEKAEKLSKMAGGSLGKALGEVVEAGDLAHQKFQDWMRKCLMSDYSSLVAFSDAFGGSSKSQQRSDLEFAISLIRESLISYAEEPALLNGDEAEKTFIQKFAKAIRFDQLERIYQWLNEALLQLERNANPRITFLDLSLRFCELIGKAK